MFVRSLIFAYPVGLHSKIDDLAIMSHRPKFVYSLHLAQAVACLLVLGFVVYFVGVVSHSSLPIYGCLGLNFDRFVGPSGGFVDSYLYSLFGVFAAILQIYGHGGYLDFRS